jgi:RNA polymerase primary sigma factor
MQEGVFGLQRAVDLFDAQRHHEFSTYAFHWIRQSIQRAIANKDRLIRIPIHRLRNRYHPAQRHPLPWTVPFTATEFGAAEQYPDRFADEPITVATGCELRAVIDDALSTLHYREREVIKYRFGIADGYTYTLEEIGRIFHVTRERIRQNEESALRKLRHPVRSSALLTAYDGDYQP